MKTKISLLVLTLLFSSCYSYRAVDLSMQLPVPGERYKIETLGSNAWEGKVVASNDSLITLQLPNTILPIPVSKILTIRHGRFSVGQTIALSVLGTGVFYCIATLIDKNTNYFPSGVY